MVLDAQMLEGFPEIKLGRGGTDSSIRAEYKIPWSQIGQAVAEVFPSPLAGYVCSASFPGFPSLVAKTVEFYPFHDKAAPYDNPDWTLWYDDARVVINYAPRSEDRQVQSGPSGDGSGPGGSAGSTGGQEVTFVSHKIAIGGEFLTYPQEAIQWDQPAALTSPGEKAKAALRVIPIQATLNQAVDAFKTKFVCDPFKLPDHRELEGVIGNEVVSVTGVTVDGRTKTVTLTVTRGVGGTAADNHVAGSLLLLSNPSTQPARLVAPGPNLQVAVSIPTLEHTIDWNYVARPPFLALRQLVGKVNAYWYAGAPPECMLFIGAECSQDVTSTGSKPWKMSYKFTEKNQNALDPNNPQGWNFFLRPNGDNPGTFQRMRKRIRLIDGVAPSTTLAVGSAVTDTTIVVADRGAFPPGGQFLVKVNNEIMAVTAFIQNQTMAVLRGVSGTQVAVHNNGSTVTLTNAGVYDIADFRYLFVS
jgi:hypothetical protein